MRRIGQAACQFVNDAVPLWRWCAIPARLVVVGRERDIDKVPTGGIKVKRAIVVSPACDRRERSVLTQNLVHFRRRLGRQAPLRDLGDDRMPLRPPRVSLRKEYKLNEAGNDEFSHERPPPFRRAAIGGVKTPSALSGTPR